MSTLPGVIPTGGRPLRCRSPHHHRTILKRSLLMAAVLGAAASAPLAAAPAQAASCTMTVTSNTKLTKDVNCNITIKGSVVLDLGGHTVRGNIVGTPTNAPSHDVKITNGKVYGNIVIQSAKNLELQRLDVDATSTAVIAGSRDTAALETDAAIDKIVDEAAKLLS